MMQRFVSLGTLSRPWATIGVIIALFLGATLSPAPAVAADRNTDVQKWLDQLSSPIPSARASAYRHLTALRRDDLSSLHDALRDRAPLFADREDLLQDIVIQVFLATEPYPADPHRGFLGVRFDLDQGVKFETDFYEETPYNGVEVRHLIPGLSASQYLEEGDVILRVQADQRILEPQRAEELQNLVLDLPAGTHLLLSVQRRGAILPIELILGGRPRALERDLDLSEFTVERATDAQAYWEKHFQPLFTPAPTSRAAASANITP